MQIKYLALLLILSSGTASAQTTINGPSATVPTTAGNNTWGGKNVSTGSNSATPSAAECGTTLTPAHNVVNCTLTAPTTFGIPSPFVADTFYLVTVTENSTGGNTLAVPNPGYAQPAGASYVNGSGTVAISTAANAVNDIRLHTEVVNGVNTVVVDGVNAAITQIVPSATYSVTSAQSAQGGGGAQTVTPGATLTLTNGDTLLAYVFSCGDGSCGTNGPVPSSISVSTGTIGTCTVLSGTIVGPNTLEALKCPITASGTNSVITANFATNASFSNIIVVDVHRSPAATLTDEAIGINASGNSATASTAAITPTQSANIVFGFNANAGNITDSVASPWTALQNSLGFTLEYQIVTPASAVTPTITLSPSSNWRMIAGALN